MKSNIDWNEIYPLLSQESQQLLMQEAITILSNPKLERAARIKRRTVNGSVHNGRIRLWRDAKMTGQLWHPSRTYLISAKPRMRIDANSEVGRFWTAIAGSSELTYAELTKAGKGFPSRTSALVAYLWNRHFLDIKP